MEAYDANYVGGDINGGIAGRRQLLFRPVVRWNPYSTPDAGDLPVLVVHAPGRRRPRHERRARGPRAPPGGWGDDDRRPPATAAPGCGCRAGVGPRSLPRILLVARGRASSDGRRRPARAVLRRAGLVLAVRRPAPADRVAPAPDGVGPGPRHTCVTGPIDGARSPGPPIRSGSSPSGQTGRVGVRRSPASGAIALVFPAASLPTRPWRGGSRSPVGHRRSLAAVILFGTGRQRHGVRDAVRRRRPEPVRVLAGSRR